MTEPAGNPSSTQYANATTVSRKKGGKIWKTILNVIVAIAIVGGLVYNHLKNSTTYIRTNPEQILFTKQGGDYIISIDYDGYLWEVTYEPSWCTVTKNKKSFTIYCDRNYTGSDREDYVTIKSGK